MKSDSPAQALFAGSDVGVWVIDGSPPRLQRFEGSEHEVVLGEGAKPFPEGAATGAIAADGSFYLADQVGLHRFSGDGDLLWSRPGADASAWPVGKPYGVLVDPDGRVFVGDGTWEAVHVFDRDGGFLATWPLGPDVSPRHRLGHPWGIAVTGAGQVVVADTYECRVLKYAPDGRILWSFGFPSLEGKEGGLGLPTHVALDRAENVYVSDSGNDRVVKLSSDGRQIGAFGPIDLPAGLAVDEEGLLYVVAARERAIRVLAGDGEILGVHDLSQRVEGLNGLALGPGGTLYATDARGKRIALLTTNGKFLGVVRFADPRHGGDLCILPDGACVVADADNTTSYLIRLKEKKVEALTAVRAFGVAFAPPKTLYLTTDHQVERFSIEG